MRSFEGYFSMMPCVHNSQTDITSKNRTQSCCKNMKTTTPLFLFLISLLPYFFLCNGFVPHHAPTIRTTTTATTTTTTTFGRKNVILWDSKSPGPSYNKNSTSLGVSGGFFTTPESPLHRMRRRKIAIYQKKKMYATGYLFALWYIFSVAYNIFSKTALNMAPSLAWTTATLQMSLGLTYVFPLWKTGIREQPKLSLKDMFRLLPVAILHSLVHIGGVVSMGAGAVSFTYIVKASEPAISAVMSAMAGSILPASVYLTILPVMGGVALASVSELSFTWKSFNYAMLSNIASAGRGIVGKRAINKRLGQKMTASNLYAVLTMMATAFLIPVTLLMEGSVMNSAFTGLRASRQLTSYIVQTFLASLFYYLYNEVAFLCLDNVSPVSHALGNTLKRVFIIISSMIVFGNRMTLRGAIGSAIAIGGVLLYSLEKTRQSKIAKENKNKA